MGRGWLNSLLVEDAQAAPIDALPQILIRHRTVNRSKTGRESLESRSIEQVVGPRDIERLLNRPFVEAVLRRAFPSECPGATVH